MPGLPDVAVALDSVGYRLDGLRDVLGVEGDISAARADLAIYERRLDGNAGPLADVIAVLALGWSRPADAVLAALGRSAVDVLAASGALVEQDGRFTATLRIVPHGDLWLAADRRPEPGSSAGELHVTGINPPATLLAAMTVRRPVGRALDVGTGNGIQALLAAQHCDRVVATDVNPRALAFAAFNAALNGIDGIEFRLGSLLEPVAGERFDLIVSNPPYVISPEHDYVYRDSGAEPGALCAELVAALPGHLADGGYASVLASWPVGDEWWQVPASWLGADSRAWLLQMRTEDSLTHARQWNAPLADGGAGLPAFTAAVDRWVRYLDEQAIKRIGYGAVVLQQRRGEPTVVRADEVRAGAGSASAHIERVFAAYDLVGDDTDLTDLTAHVPSEHRLERSMQFVDGGWRYGAALVALAEGVGIEASLDPLMTEVLLQVTSGATVREAARSVSPLAGIEPDQSDDLAAAASLMVRELVHFGMVVPGPYPGR